MNQAGATMQSVVASIADVTVIMGEISAASVEQSAGIEQVNSAIAQMDQVTQHNARLVDEVAASSNLLRRQAEQLAQVVNVFRLAAATCAPVMPPVMSPTARPGHRALASPTVKRPAAVL